MEKIIKSKPDSAKFTTIKGPKTKIKEALDELKHISETKKQFRNQL